MRDGCLARQYRIRMPMNRLAFLTIIIHYNDSIRNNSAVALLRAFICFLLLLPAAAVAQTYAPPQAEEEYDYPLMDRGSTLQAYYISPYLVQEKTVVPDTAALNFYYRCMPESRSIAMGYLSNMASPWHNKSFFDRQYPLFTYAFNAPFAGMIYTPQRELFYNTKAPYTKVT